MKLRHLPKFGLIALIVGSFLLLTGTTYAVVKTVEHFNNIQLNTANTNDYGRQQLSISFDGCRDSRKDVTYELKKGGNLSTEDGVKTLQARCDMDTIDTWFTDIEPIEFGRPFYMNRMDTVTSISGKTVSFETASPVTLQENSKVLSDNKEIALSQLKVGSTVYVYPGYSSSIPNDHPLRIFVVSQVQKYYGLDYQSYVNERGPCTGNKTLTCLSASNINHTVLMITFGGGINDPRIGQSYRVAQGRVVSYDSKTITLDVGKGVTYTVQTPSNILDTFNKKTVFDLANIDAIYAETKPEDLMVKIGDNLEITYLGDDADTSTNLQWSDIIGVQLMVERIPDNLDVLRKY